MYYDIRRPIFDYFKRLLFMPAKHCVYKRKLKTSEKEEFHYSAVDFENILLEKKGDYTKYPTDSRERFINCKSPVATDWAKENEKGELVTEVGFFGKKRKYYLRTKKEDTILSVKTEDPFDEKNPFTIWKTILMEEKNLLFDIVLEPDFGEEYYDELHASMLKGTDLSPYINESVIKDPDIPRDSSTGQIRLNRVLSYKTELEISKRISEKIITKGFRVDSSSKEEKEIEMKAEENLSIALRNTGIFMGRWFLLKSAVNKLKDHSTRRKLEEQFSWESRRLIDIGRTTTSIETTQDYPFFTQVYEDYKNFQIRRDDGIGHQEISSASFIKDHPATLYSRANGSLVFIPYRDTVTNEIDINENLPAQLFRRFNQFSDCIEKEQNLGILCEDREEKEAYTEILLKHYYIMELKNQD